MEVLFQYTFYIVRSVTLFILVSILTISLFGQDSAPLVFVQFPKDAEPAPSHQGQFLPSDKYVDGARIVSLNPNNPPISPVNLTPDFASACDPDIAFDGQSIVFAGKKTPGDFWQIWRMNIDGSNKEQLTHQQGNCVAPVHAGARFFLNDPQPVLQIIYASDTHGWYSELNEEPAYSLYAIDITGERIHRLTYNLNSDYEPDVLPNGRIVYSSWQRYADRFGQDGIIALLGVNNDGTDLMPYYGNHEGPRYKEFVSVGSDGRAYFIESEQSHWLGGGALGYVKQNRPLHSHSILTEEKNALFTSPSPLPDTRLLVSYRAKKKNETYALCELSPESGKIQQTIFQDPQWHSVDAHLVTSRKEALGRSNWLIPGEETGGYFSINTYRSDLAKYQGVPAGSIKFLRVLEGLPRKSPSVQGLSPKSGYHSPTRILGVVPVEKDGSFNIRIPAMTPVTFQLLDENRMAIQQQRSWTWVMGNESRGCIGCHENRELAPPNKMVDAVTKEPLQLTLPPDRRRTVDFRHQIAPIVQQKCATSGCHAGNQGEPTLTGQDSQQIYNTLVPPDYVKPGHAKESPLIWHIFGKKFKTKVSKSELPQVHGDVLLSNKERTLFIEWIDLGAHWDVSSYITD